MSNPTQEFTSTSFEIFENIVRIGTQDTQKCIIYLLLIAKKNNNAYLTPFHLECLTPCI